ncbi:hypothetical protein D3C78_1610290 [compost metagenome]
MIPKSIYLIILLLAIKSKSTSRTGTSFAHPKPKRIIIRCTAYISMEAFVQQVGSSITSLTVQHIGQYIS